MVDDTERRIREKAYELWVAEGRPEGRHESHWDEAREIVALQDAGGSPTIPLKDSLPEAEPAVAVENQGEFPGLRDQGDAPAGPSLDAAADAAGAPPAKAEPRRKRSGKDEAPAPPPAAPAKVKAAPAAKGKAAAAPEAPKPPRGRKG